MHFKRTFHNSVVLPDGSVFATGGQGFAASEPMVASILPIESQLASKPLISTRSSCRGPRFVLPGERLGPWGLTRLCDTSTTVDLHRVQFAASLHVHGLLVAMA